MTSPTTATDVGTDVLVLEHVCAGYGPYRALFDVSFRVPAGAVVALVGSNGAGKSTVARTVTGLVTATDSVSLRLACARTTPPDRIRDSAGSASDPLTTRLKARHADGHGHGFLSVHG